MHFHVFACTYMKVCVCMYIHMYGCMHNLCIAYLFVGAFKYIIVCMSARISVCVKLCMFVCKVFVNLCMHACTAPNTKNSIYSAKYQEQVIISVPICRHKNRRNKIRINSSLRVQDRSCQRGSPNK